MSDPNQPHKTHKISHICEQHFGKRDFKDWLPSTSDLLSSHFERKLTIFMKRCYWQKNECVNEQHNIKKIT